METKKNQNGIIVILILLVIGLGGYIAYDKLSTKNTINTENSSKKEDNKSDQKCSTIEPLRLDSTEVDALEKVIDAGIIYDEGNNLFFSDKEITYDEISERLTNMEEPSCTFGPQTLHFIVSAYKENNKYTAIVKVIFPESYDKPNDYDTIFYTDYARTKLLTDIDYNKNTIPTLTLDNMRKGSTYELTFTNSNGDYKFVTSKPLNN